MSEKKTGEKPLVAFFDALIEDSLDRKIIKMVSENFSPEEILEQLLSESFGDGSE